MKTRIVEGVPPRSDDQVIALALEDDADPWGGGGKGMVIGIAGPDGRAYRVVETVGLGEYMGACATLEGFGLRDLLEKPAGGLDSLFR